MARKNISFNFLDQLSETLHFIADDSKAVLWQPKGTCLLTECLSVHAHEKLVDEIMQARRISILCDKATDITMNKIFCVNVRFLPSGSTEPVTKLYRLLPVENGKADGLFESLKAAPKTRLLVTHQTARTSCKEKTIPFWRECKMRPAQTFSF